MTIALLSVKHPDIRPAETQQHRGKSDKEINFPTVAAT